MEESMPDQLTHSMRPFDWRGHPPRGPCASPRCGPRYFAGSRRCIFRPSGRRRLCQAILWIETDMEV